MNMQYDFVWRQEHPLVLEDLKAIAADAVIPWTLFKDSRILVTGATGLIGTFLVKALLYYADTQAMPCTVVALSRSKEKGLLRFASLAPLMEAGLLEVAEGDVQSPLPESLAADYILHAASVTASAEMVSNPVGTIMTTLDGTRHVLELARRANCRSCLFLSSMEVYGKLEHELVQESDCGYLNLSTVRNCYPLSKRLAENLCVAYHAQHGVHAKIARLTLTFGPGIPKSDNRVFAQFVHSVLENRDIVMHTAGTTKRDYLYTADAVRALLTILLLGADAEAYNVSDPASYVTIRELAEITQSFNPAVKVIVQADPEQAKKYAGEVHINLDNAKLNALNNFPRTHVREMVARLLEYMRSC